MQKFERMLFSSLKPWFYRGKVIVLIGARQVGKSTLYRDLVAQTGQDSLWLNADLPEIRALFAVPTLANLKATIANYKLVVIDEIQRIENAGLILKTMVDNFPEVQFLATGSSVLEISETIFEPLTGRQVLFHLYPMTFTEMYGKASDFELEQVLNFHLIFGNYPEVCVKQDLAQKLITDLSEQYLYKDILMWKDLRKPELLDKLLKLLALQIGGEVNVLELSNKLNVKSDTINTYLDLLEKSCVIFRLNAFSNNARKEIGKKAKIYFWDNGIRNSIIGDFDLVPNRTDIGALWENFIVSERMKMNDYNQKPVKSYFWRDYNKSEVDYVEVSKGVINAFEIKWNSMKKFSVSKAFTNLYPEAQTEVITPKNFSKFVFGI